MIFNLLYLDNILLPFQGEGFRPIFPRALPWANVSLAFQAVCLMAYHYLRKSKFLILNRQGDNF